MMNARREDLELIVVDDGSTDERTREAMNEVEARGVKAIRQKNKGLAGARNAGISASHGEYIFPLDADDRLRDGICGGSNGALELASGRVRWIAGSRR